MCVAPGNRWFAYAAMVVASLLGPSSALGQEALVTTPAWTLSLPAQPNPRQSPFILDRADSTRRPQALVPLYASLTVLQGLDVHSTMRGLSSGGSEANPVMAPVVKNRAAFIAIKAATTAGVVFAAERLWRKKNRKAAVLLTVLTNAGMAAVVAHNYRAAR